MKTSLKSNALLLLTLILFSVQSPAQWTNISSSPRKYVRHLTFPLEKVGYAMMEDSGTARDNFHKTIDGGLTWQEIELDSATFRTADIRSLFFSDSSTGYIAFRSFAPSVTPFLYKTTDGGLTWNDVSPLNLDVGNGYMDVHFVDNQIGYLTSGNQIQSTSDGGQNWTVEYVAGFGGPIEIDFYNADYGIIGAWDGSFAYMGRIYTTTDGGSTWDSLYLPQINTAIFKVEYTRNFTAYAITEFGFGVYQYMYKTINHGISWDTIPLLFLVDSLDQASDMYFESDSIGYLSTLKGFIYLTLDGGQTWKMDHIEGRALNLLASNGPHIFSGGPVNTLLINDIFVGIGPPLIKQDLIVYPNPVGRKNNLYFNKPLNGQLTMYSLDGKVEASQVLHESNKVRLNRMDLKSGLYLYVIDGKEQYTGKILVR